MKLSSLLAQRRSLIKQAQLANLAFAYDRLSDFTKRIMRAQLSGKVRLKQAEPNAERYVTSLTAMNGSQAVIEEHFTDDDLMDLADVIAYVTSEYDIDLTFRLEELGIRFLVPLRAQLVHAGIVFDHEYPAPEESNSEGSTGFSRSEEG